jgi:hypothetical protein
MLRILQTVLVLFSLLALAFVAAKANSAPLSDGAVQWQSPAIGAGQAASPCRHPHRSRIVPGPQAGTHLQAQPFAYGYFGAHAPTTAAFHTGNRGDWYQWTFSRAD